jgi:hypothetical protein
MAASYQNLRPRALTRDDVEGICALYPPMTGSLECSVAGFAKAGVDAEACAEATNDHANSDGSCSMATPRRTPTRAAWLLLSLLAVVVLRRFSGRIVALAS